jgi:hypothetical protein
MGKKRYVYRVWWGKLEGKRPLGRPRHVWEDNIRVYTVLQNLGWEGLD